MGPIDAIADILRHKGATYVRTQLARHDARRQTANLASRTMIGHHSLTGRARRASVQPSGRLGRAYEGTVT
jgi:hypothetical protein